MKTSVFTPLKVENIKSKEQFWSQSAFLSTKWTRMGLKDETYGLRPKLSIVSQILRMLNIQ